jgi:hypothetical protein
MKLNKHFLISCLFIILSASFITARDHTFFSPRDITTDSTYELALTYYDIYHNNSCPEPWFNFYVTPLYQKSVKAERLARYFLPNNKETITIAENGSGDVNSLWLNIIAANGSNFSSLFSIRPNRIVYGADFNFRFTFDRICKNLWASVVFAAIKAKHNLHICERDITNPGIIPGFADATEALTNPIYTSGRFYRDSKSRAGVDDIQFKLGYDYFYCADNHLGIYAVATAPTGKKHVSKYIFQPIVGTKHASAGVGINGDYLFYQNCNATATFMFDLKFLHYFKAKEDRSFDLINGDWSRYLLVVQAATPLLTVPLINLLTNSAQVRRGNTVQLWTALHWQQCNYNFEVGYNLWWRAQEQVKACCVPSNFGIFDISGVCGNLLTASTAQISQGFLPPNNAVSDSVFTPITLSQINCKSAAAPHALSNKIYGAIGYDSQWCNQPLLIGFGGSYEFAHTCGALNQWAVWGKFGLNF